VVNPKDAGTVKETGLEDDMTLMPSLIAQVAGYTAVFVAMLDCSAAARVNVTLIWSDAGTVPLANEEKALPT
jgi:hypothetical protein